ncbi:glycosyltransferase family 2 protein [bacterium]|nr:glycosyltransferase family 2 protein [bacterium]MBU1884501.1 glycosyltransferase family 2 protein [bacterium]
MIFPLLKNRLLISIVVICYNMKEEVLNTLFSLSQEYQLDIKKEEYEIIVIDNGSKLKHRLQEKDWKDIDANIKYYYIDDAKSSPVEALNYGVSLTKGKIIGLMIDGARMLSPGVLSNVKEVFSNNKEILVTVPNWHIGPDLQNKSVLNGYSKVVERNLLNENNCFVDGYNLFSISTLAASCQYGCFMPFSESNALFMYNKAFKKLNGFDKKFNLPGGGLVNLDFYTRALCYHDDKITVLFGEGNFHQLHGGIASNASGDDQKDKISLWREQYKKIRSSEYRVPKQKMIYYGAIQKEVIPYLKLSAQKYMEFYDERK